jgi:lipopolysaccharide/colanic/teichoic acid biosynthesis glycosyltransferase
MEVTVHNSIRELNQDPAEAKLLIANYLDLDDPYTFQVETGSPFNIENLKGEFVTGLVNHKRMNDHRFVNKFMESVNAKMLMGGTYICCVETKESRRVRLLSKFNPIIAYPFFLGDFFVKRVIPKIPVLKTLYFALTKGLNRVMSFPEVLGRIISCGFKVVKVHEIGSMTWFVVEKVAEPNYDMSPTYGPFVKLWRVGQNGKLIGVYKLRTMHPFSEYIQEYIFDQNNLKKGGKIDDDYRITKWGKVLRKLWLDEFPMLANVIRGELKLVGVRPLSQHYFSLYPKEMQEFRTRFKPGLIPPFYSDIPETFEEILDSERRYLESYAEKPISTDIRYFFKSMFNIIFKGARSS